MKQVLLSVEESKYKFLLQILEQFDFVKIEKSGIEKKAVLKEIADGMNSAALAAKGEIPSRLAKAILHEL